MFPKEKYEKSHPHVARWGGGMSSGAHPCVHQGAWESVQAKYLYDSIDTDHSGTITYKEFESYIKKHETGHCGQHLTDEQRQEIFELMDLNHSGAIDRKEFEQCRKDFGGEWTVANFNDIIWKLKSKTPHGSCPTSPTARSRGSSPTALARPLNGTLPTSPTVRSRKASPTPNGRVTSPTAMRPNGCFSMPERDTRPSPVERPKSERPKSLFEVVEVQWEVVLDVFGCRNDEVEARTPISKETSAPPRPIGPHTGVKQSPLPRGVVTH